MNDPDWFFRKSAEEGRLDPLNPYILTDHVKCACFELPFGKLGTGDWGLLGTRDWGLGTGGTDKCAPSRGGNEQNQHVPAQEDSTAYKNGSEPLGSRECRGGAESFGPETQNVLEYLEEVGIVRHTGGSENGRWHWADRSFPAEGISLRSASADNVVIIDITAGRNAVIGEMDRPGAKEMLFNNAVYIHRGRQFLVENLDIENRKCHVREAEVNYFTDGLVKTDIKVLTEDERFYIPSPQSPISLEAVLGDVLVRSQVTKFKKIRFHTHENIGYGEIDLPEEEMQTQALMLLFGPESSGGKALAEMDENEAGESLSGAGALIRSIAPVFLLCEPRDLGIAERVRDTHFGIPALYVYDKYPGGTGLAEGLSRKTDRLFSAVNGALLRCPCKSGCPSCVGPGDNKAAAKEFIRALCT
jgi:DEAD/DEAH box helicase domain-containing protein